MEREELNNIISRIDKEMPNFQHLINGLPYNSNHHKKAVEVYSFKLLETEILKLTTNKIFKKNIKQILECIKNKDALILTNQLNELKPKLINQLKIIKSNKENPDKIISIKPNIFGIGIDLRAFWNKITSKN
jgi:hypothetical protein